jgi:hypothetical protein
MMAIIRLTYGAGTPKRHLSASVIRKATGMDLRATQRAISTLAERGLIHVRRSPGIAGVISINERFTPEK